MKLIFEKISGRIGLLSVLQAILILAPSIDYLYLQLFVVAISLYLIFLTSSSIIDECEIADSSDYYAPQIKWVVIVLYLVSVIYFPIFFTYNPYIIFIIFLFLFFISRTEILPHQMQGWNESAKKRYYLSTQMRHKMGYIFLLAAFMYVIINWGGDTNIIKKILTIKTT